MNKEINRLLDELEDEDTLDQLESSMSLINLLLVQIDRLQSFAESHGLTQGDYEDFVETRPQPTIH